LYDRNKCETLQATIGNSPGCQGVWPVIKSLVTAKYVSSAREPGIVIHVSDYSCLANPQKSMVIFVSTKYL